MAFIQQGPRRPRHVTPAQDASTTLTSEPSTSYHSLRASTTSTLGSPTEDWSIVFPGRTRPLESVNDVAQTIIPSHDGTGTFAEEAGTSGGTDSLESSDELRSSSLLISDGRDFIDEDALYFEEDECSHSSSSGPPPSLLSSANDRSTFGQRNAASTTQRGSSPSASSISSDHHHHPLSPTASHFSFLDDDATHPTWSWQQEGETRVLASTTPRQQSPNRHLASIRSSVIYASDSEPEDNEVTGTSQRRRGTTLALPRIEDVQYEDALEMAPCAISAGLRPRRDHLTAAHPLTHPDRSSSVLSGSQASAGFKRRHRSQHDGQSVRSSKSRRSELIPPLLDVTSTAKGQGCNATIASRLHPTSERHRHQQFHHHSATNSSFAPAVSKKEKVAKLLGKIFDVDADVYNSLMHDEGPLALTSEERHMEAQEPPSFGFEHEQLEIDGHAARRGKRWKELIDGRIVEDLEGEEYSVDEAQRAEDVAREEERIERDLIPSHDSYAYHPISALSRAGWSNVKLPSTSIIESASGRSIGDPTLEEAIRHTLARTLNASQQTPTQAVTVGLSQVTPDLPAILSSTADALSEVMPYFVPFSWRLLMRLVREWRQEDARRDSSPSQEHNLSSNGKGDVGGESAGGELSDERSLAELPPREEEEEREPTLSASIGRGRSRERKNLYDSVGSSWSLATSSGTATTGDTTRVIAGDRQK